MLDRLGRIPEAGDAVSHDGWEIEVAEMDGLRIASLRAVAPSPWTAVVPDEGGDS